MAVAANGVVVPAGSDVFNPQADLTALNASLHGRIAILAPNATGRTNLQTTCGWTPSATDPLVVYQTDTKCTWSWDGTTWTQTTGTADVSSQITKPSGSLVTTFQAYLTGQKLVTCQIQMAGSGSSYAIWASAPMLTIPVNLRPTADVGCAVPWLSSWACNLSASTGAMTVGTNAATTMNTGTYSFSLSWVTL